MGHILASSLDRLSSLVKGREGETPSVMGFASFTVSVAGVPSSPICSFEPEPAFPSRTSTPGYQAFTLAASASVQPVRRAVVRPHGHLDLDEPVLLLFPHASAVGRDIAPAATLQLQQRKR